jgi:hypothetical protein
MSPVEHYISDHIWFSRLSRRVGWRSAPDLNRALVVSPRNTPCLVMIGRVLTTNEWIEVNTDDFTTSDCATRTSCLSGFENADGI